MLVTLFDPESAVLTLTALPLSMLYMYMLDWERLRHRSSSLSVTMPNDLD